jgi:hypothetical protein
MWLGFIGTSHGREKPSKTKAQIRQTKSRKLNVEHGITFLCVFIYKYTTVLIQENGAANI